MKKIFVFLASLLLSASLFANNYLNSANRRTAVRCLKLSESYLSAKDYGNALSQSELGLAYDSSVSDLWYVQAVCKMGLGEKRTEVIELVRKAMYEGEWVDYNRDNARVLYADLLCDTDLFDQAVAILDSKPFIYSADSEFIRLKAYYRSGTPENLIKAREKVDSARKIYPSDKRFAKLFFKHEYARKVHQFDFFSQNDDQALVQKIADYFISKMPEYDNPDAELEIYSTFFAEGEQRRRMLQAFVAHGMEHPLYAQAALETGLLSQQEAWDYFCNFADESIDLFYLNNIIPLFDEEITIQSIQEHLNAYNGTLFIDTDGDLESDLTVKYSRGRAMEITLDENNDGTIDCFAHCDFGVPVDMTLPENIELTYGTYPSVVKMQYDNPYGNGKIVYNFMDESFNWTPFIMESLPSVKMATGFDFFVPFVDSSCENLFALDYTAYCSNYQIESDERSGALISFNVLNGQIQTAEYTVNGIPFAYAVFEKGMPYSRSVDNDGDGIFEVTEIYGYDSTNKFMSEEEERRVLKNLCGKDFSGTGIYIKLIQIDTTGDTVPNFTEEYDVNGGKTDMWDYNSDGNWDVRYKRYPRASLNDPLYEESQFYKMPENILVTVNYENSVPVKVSENEIEYAVTPGTTKGFYWVGEYGNFDDEKYIFDNIAGSLSQGKTEMVQRDNRRMTIVKVADDYFAEFLGETLEIQDDFYTDSIDAMDLYEE